MKKFLKYYFLLLLFCFSEKVFSQMATPASPKEIHVSTLGSDKNDGTPKDPVKTISQAVSRAFPGDIILVSGGVYRESVLFERGGDSEINRITLRAKEKQKVIIKGSDRQTGWQKKNDNIWECMVDAIDSNITLYFNGVKLIRVSKPGETRESLKWTSEKSKRGLIIRANFGGENPNTGLSEIAIRDVGISSKGSVDYITVEGISVSQIVNGPASIYGLQSGGINTNNGTHWKIANCVISECKSVGVSIGVTGHAYQNISPRKPEFSDFTDISSVGHHTVVKNHVYRCGQAGIFGFLGGSSSVIEDNLIEQINEDNSYVGSESGGIRLAMAVDATITHNLIREIHGDHGYGLYLGPIFQGTRISKNIISNTSSHLMYFFKNHGPVLVDNNVLAMPQRVAGAKEGVRMESSEANVFVQNLFSNCYFSNGNQSGKPVSTSNFLPHSLVIKQTIPALNIDHRWYANLFIGKGLSIPKSYGCESDYNAYLGGAHPSEWADANSIKTNDSPRFTLEHTPKGVDMNLETELLRNIHIPELTSEYLGFFALSKQFVESPKGEKIKIDRDFFERKLKSSMRKPGPFSLNDKKKYHVKLF